MINKMRIMDIPSEMKADVLDKLEKLLGLTYYEIGQNPHKEDIVQMAIILYNDLTTTVQFKTMSLDDVYRAFRKGVRTGDEASVFLNVRTWNIWLRAQKKKVSKKVIEHHKKNELEYLENARLMGGTINKAKQIK